MQFRFNILSGGIFALLIMPGMIIAQDFKGQWKGEFEDKSTSFSNWGGEKCEYVLELESHKNNIHGYSYTYFSEGGKKFYTICKVQGKLDKKQKFLEITEIERVKTNIPKEINNCFQIHRLTYFKKGQEEILEGDWVPVPNQKGDCGFGKTNLARRVLDNSFINRNLNQTSAKANNKENSSPSVTKKISEKSVSAANKKSNNTEPPKDNIVPETNLTISQNNKTEKSSNDQPSEDKVGKYEKRANALLKTIEVSQSKIRVELFDNGEIDGDSISIFLNKKLLISHKRLSEKPISLNIELEENLDEFELEMYAENLGSIPPNTAVMVITDGNKRYETRITSDLKKSGVIRLVRKK